MKRGTSGNKEVVRGLLQFIDSEGNLNYAHVQRDTEGMGVKVSTQSLGQFLRGGALGPDRVAVLWRWLVVYLSELLKRPEAAIILKTELSGGIQALLRDPLGPAVLVADTKCKACGSWTPAEMAFCGRCGVKHDSNS